MAKITYDYLRYELVECENGLPHVFNYGIIRKSKYQSVWHEGSEEHPQEKVQEVVSTLEKVVNEHGNKKYRNIKIV